MMREILAVHCLNSLKNIANFKRKELLVDSELFHASIRRPLFMSTEKLKIQDLVRRIDELIRILKFLSEDLAEISQNLKAGVGDSQMFSAESTKPLSQPKTSQHIIATSEPQVAPILLGSIKSAEDAQKGFPQDLLNMLYFEETGDNIIVRPKLFLGSDNFRRIASIIREQLGGEYVSAGKDSHFRIPKRD